MCSTAGKPHTSLLAPRILLAVQGLIAVFVAAEARTDAFGGATTGLAGAAALTIPFFPLAGGAILLLRDYALGTKTGYMLSYAGLCVIQSMAVMSMLA